MIQIQVTEEHDGEAVQTAFFGPELALPIFPTKISVVDFSPCCTAEPVVPHSNCVYNGKRPGHRANHCTADGCW